ncbi:MAG TPA: acyltransferase [Candidatus Nanoarchaeia archaeon]|nr:acyltransferase [Candidatus Nanoarchaeia archaeon]
MAKAFIHPKSDVSKNSMVGEGSKVWSGAFIREHARIGKNCIIGSNAYIDHDVQVGDNVKIQNNCLIYYMTILENGVFIGPGVIITNDKMPRAIDENGRLKTASEWKAETTKIMEGASVGAGSVLLPGIKIGKFSLVGAGSVVTKDVEDFSIVYGNPAKKRGYLCRCGSKKVSLPEIKKHPKISCKKCKSEITIKTAK